jgi:hypothetical protein
VIDKGTMLLQNCLDILKVEPGSVSETCPATSRNGNQIIDVKVEVSDTQEEQDPLLISLPEIKAEYEVSCMCACPMLSTFKKYSELYIVFIISVCLHLTAPFH